MRTNLSRLLMAIGLGCLLTALVSMPAESCRFWAMVGGGYPGNLISNHLRDGAVANLRGLGAENRDGWGLASFLPPRVDPELIGPIVRRGGPAANHPFDPDYGLAVDEMQRLRPRAAMGHVRRGSSGHSGIPDPHPLQHAGWYFAHNGTVPVELMLDLLTLDDPTYLDRHPLDYVQGFVDSELFMLYLMKFVETHPALAFPDALQQAIRELAVLAPGHRLNFVMTDGDTLIALRYAAGDGWDPVRYGPADSRTSPFWVVASQVMGSQEMRWGTIPAGTLAVFVPGATPVFLPIDRELRVDAAPSLRVGTATPNPVREGLQVSLQVPLEGAMIGFDVWDVQGRLVRTQGSIWAEPGERFLQWDGRNAGGHPVASGLYFLRVRADQGVWEQRVTVLR